MLNASNYPSRSALRKALRSQRRSLSKQQQNKAALALNKQLRQIPAVLFAKNIALYMAADGEITASHFSAWAKRRSKQIWLPVIHPLQHNKMRLAKLSSRWRKNRFGIAEPKIKYAATKPAWLMDVICMPLVGFDAAGNRLGMGKGFYDRTLAFLLSTHAIKAPKLIGLAHECQQVDYLPAAEWDVPLDLIATDRGIIIKQS